MTEDARKRREELEERMLQFAGAVIDLVLALSAGAIRDIVGRQLLRSATSIGANYSEANRGESRADFIHKVAISEKEAAETVYWLRLCQLKRCGDPARLQALLTEAGELLAILVTIGRRAKSRT